MATLREVFGMRNSFCRRKGALGYVNAVELACCYPGNKSNALFRMAFFKSVPSVSQLHVGLRQVLIRESQD